MEEEKDESALAPLETPEKVTPSLNQSNQFGTEEQVAPSPPATGTTAVVNMDR